jgi:uncharacterized surface protein with fasciclin (FAS1) repeats
MILCCFVVSMSHIQQSPITSVPTLAPTAKATTAPVTRTVAPTIGSTTAPTRRMTTAPVNRPTTSSPTSRPTRAPTDNPTQAPTNVRTSAPVQLRTLLDIVQTVPELQSLEDAILLSERNKNSTLSSLTSILNQSSPVLTLFAPSNEAFTALTQEPFYANYITTPFSLHLFNLLAFHVYSPAFNTSDFPIDNLPNIVGGSVNVQESARGRFFISSANPTNSRIIDPDIPASNGIAHIVDSVIWPPFINQNALQAIDELGDDFKLFRDLITLAGFEDLFANLASVTILATPNNAYQIETERFLRLPENRETLQAYLLYQVIDPLFNFAAVAPPFIDVGPTQQGEVILLGVIPDDSADLIQVSFNDALLRSTFFSRDTLGCVIDRLVIPTTLENLIPRSLSSGVSPEVEALMQMAGFDENVFTSSRKSAQKQKEKARRRRRQRPGSI